MKPDSDASSTRSLSLQWTGITDVGKVRKNNEDAFLALTFDACDIHYLGKFGAGLLGQMDYVFAVSDGMGGARAGEFASRIAVEKITRLLPKSFRAAVMGMSVDFADLLPEIFVETHKAMSYLGAHDSDCAGMGATLSLCWFTPKWMYFGHIGDSRIYYFPAEGGMKQISNDDTHVGWLFRQGKINEREMRTHPRRNALQKALGAGHQFVEPQVGSIGFQAGDRFLICSDGLVDGLWDKNILQLLSEPTPEEQKISPAQRLVSAAVEKSGKDNTTALVIEIIPQPEDQCVESDGAAADIAENRN